MPIQKYSVNQHPIQTLLSWINSSEIAIPEIQRPFVWDGVKVRDFIDSLYRGYPVGYLILWRNPNVRLKDGSISFGKRILIDGQQRITALMTSILGWEIVDKDYQKRRIKIAFHPVEKRFEVANPAIEKDKSWIKDISVVFSSDFRLYKMVDEYCQLNPSYKKEDIFESLESLRGIVNNYIGLIELNSDLDIDTVNEIFVRINSAGVSLSQADFAMSKIAVNEKFGGMELRKAIDYFCHLAIKPEFYENLKKLDPDFTNTSYFQKMEWLKKENDNLFDPKYTDMLRVAFTYKFKRGKLQDLVSLLSGRNFETRAYEETIAEESFNLLKKGIFDFMNENNFKTFLMIIRSSGFIDPEMIGSRNALNFSYILYLTLKNLNFNRALIETLVRRWFVFSILTRRYSGSPESKFDYDIRQIHKIGPKEYLGSVINAELSEVFWDEALPQQMNTSVASSPFFNLYLAAQIIDNDRGFLSKEIKVKDLIEIKGDVHHVFPRQYLKKYNFSRGDYNQIANYVMAQSEINIAIGAKSPKVYFAEILEQCRSGKLKYGGIDNEEDLFKNLEENCIPKEIFEMEKDDYQRFLTLRRKLMARKIKGYFERL